MAVSRWLEWLQQDESAEHDFIEWLTARRDQIQREQDEAQTWEQTLEARGAKKSLDLVLGFINISKQEERTYARLRSTSRPA